MAIRFRGMALAGALTAAAVLGTAGAALANISSVPVSTTENITPYLIESPNPGGNVSCEEAGFGETQEEYKGNYEVLDPINNPGVKGFVPPLPSGISVTTDGTYLDWTSTSFVQP